MVSLSVNKEPALAGVAQETGHRPVNQKVASSIPSGHLPGSRARSPAGGVWEATYQDISLNKKPVRWAPPIWQKGKLWDTRKPEDYSLLGSEQSCSHTFFKVWQPVLLSRVTAGKWYCVCVRWALNNMGSLTGGFFSSKYAAGSLYPRVCICEFSRPRTPTHRESRWVWRAGRTHWLRRQHLCRHWN